MFPSAAKQQTGSMTAIGAEMDMRLQMETYDFLAGPSHS